MIDSAMPCPCGSGVFLEQCCGRYHAGAVAPSAEILMRSRYSAYVLGLIPYLVRTTLPAQQASLDTEAMEAWSSSSTWLGLDVQSSENLGGKPEHAFVTFSVRWHDDNGQHIQNERSAFVQTKGHWYFIDPTLSSKIGRNDPCICGSGSKFKKCCGPFL